jgi:hypothetical protein
MAEKSGTQSPKQKIVLSVLALAFVAAGTVLFFKRQQNEFKRNPPENIVEFESLPHDTKISAILKNKLGEASLNVEGRKILLSNAVRENFTVPYQIFLTFENPNQKQKNITLSLDQTGVQYTVSFNGFSHQDSWVLYLNGTAGKKAIPMDWAGQGSDDAIVWKYGDMVSCVDIQSRELLRFCHRLSGASKPS